MRRRGWILAAATVVGVVLAVVVGDVAVQAFTTASLASCPAKSPGDPLYSGLARSSTELVPFPPDHALLCRYNGLNAQGGAPAFALAGHAVMTGGAAAKLAAGLDAAQTSPFRGPVNCPSDDGAVLDAYFRKGHEHIRVRLELGGCGGVSNGLKHAALKGDITQRMMRLTGKS